MAGNKVGYYQNQTTLANRELSPNLWEGFRISDILENPTIGRFDFDDFRDFPLVGTQTTEIAHGKYKVFNTGAVKVTRVSAVNSVELLGGALVLPTDTDNDSASLADSYPAHLMTGTRSDGGKLIFECCIAQKSIATNMAATVIGLAETELFTLATAVPLNASDALTNGGSFIGFNLLEDGLGVINTCYSDRTAAAPTNIEAGVATLAVYTFKKLGFVYDMDRPAAERITFFVDNVPCATKFTQTQLAATTNLKANALGRIVATCADSGGTAHELYMKWWAVGQYFPGNN